MEISDELLCVFSAEVTERDDSYIIEVPKREVIDGDVRVGDGYRTALLASRSDPEETASDPEETPPVPSARENNRPGPPVEEGENRTVEIEALGDQGDGIARVERGYVVIVPDTEKGERVTIAITDVRENVAFASVEERIDYYE